MFPARFGLVFAFTSVLLATGAAVSFIDIAAPAGLTVPNTFGGKDRKEYIIESTGNGAAVLDYDGDGAADIFIANGTTLNAHGGGRSLPQLYHNDGHGRFTDVASRAGFTEQGWGQAACVGDYDNDGHPDLLVTYYGHDRLYHNNGDGTFRDVTEKAGLPVSGARYGSGCTFLDYDRDGLLDIFVANYVQFDLTRAPKPGENSFCMWREAPVFCGPHAFPPGHNILYHNNGDGTFTDVSARAGILKPGGRTGLGVVAADFDNDGWPDIYLACDQMPSLLYRNRGDGTFQERGVEAGVAYNFDGQAQAGMGVAVADYDGDGRLDIAKTNFYGDLTSLYHNDDGRFFTDVSREAGLGRRHLMGWGVAFVDVDDDGWKDLVIANGHLYPELERAPRGEPYLQETLLYRNVGAGKFAEITSSAGPAFEVGRPARGLAVGDFDGDGRPEIVIVNMNSTPSLLKNQHPGGRFLNVQLIGTKSNRSAIGARVTVTANGRRMMDEVIGGESYYSQNSLTLHFGVAAADTIQSVEIRWPAGGEQRWTNLPINEKIIVTEGSATLKRIPEGR